jgi:HD-like signal output (HDOD) protein
VRAAPVAAPPNVPAGPTLTSEESDFLKGFLTISDVKHLDELPVDDRFFLGGIRQLWHARKLDLPILPEVALRLRDLLHKGDASVGRLVALIEKDSGLTVEVLKSANSVAFGGAIPSTSVHDAIVRIGLQRLESILLLSQMRTKVLRAGALQPQCELLIELSATLGQLASKLAQRTPGADANAAFTRGTLLHVEHLVILGALSDVTKLHKRPVTPSIAAVHQAFVQFGPEIREAVARAWGLEALLVGGEDAPAIAQQSVGLRNALVERWLGYDETTTGPVDPALADLLIEVAPRTHLTPSAA